MIVYPYIIYPIVLWVLTKLSIKAEPQYIESSVEKVSFLICVYNGENHIQDKLDNIVSLDGFSDDYDIFIVSDGSTDRTNEIVSTYKHKSVKLVKTSGRIGKANAENYALKNIDNGIVIFSDISTLFKHDALHYLLDEFKDPRVGCVSTSDIIVSKFGDNEGEHEGAYVKYEMLLRKFESKLGILAGASGSGYACRKELAIQIPGHFTRDLHVPLYAKMMGKNTVSSDNAKCYIVAQSDEVGEYYRKIRTFTGGIDTLLSMKTILNPFKYGLFTWSLISHKLLRWSGGIFMFLFYLVTCVYLNESILYIGLFVLQSIFYLYSYWRFINNKRSNITIINLIYFFVITNVAALVAWKNHIVGTSFVTWKPTDR